MAARTVDPWAPIPHWRLRLRARRIRYQLRHRLRTHRVAAATVAAATATVLTAAGLILDAPLCVALAMALPYAAVRLVALSSKEPARGPMRMVPPAPLPRDLPRGSRSRAAAPGWPQDPAGRRPADPFAAGRPGGATPGRRPDATPPLVAWLIGERPNAIHALTDALTGELDGWFEPPGTTADPRPLIHHPDALARFELGRDVARALLDQMP